MPFDKKCKRVTNPKVLGDSTASCNAERPCWSNWSCGDATDLTETLGFEAICWWLFPLWGMWKSRSYYSWAVKIVSSAVYKSYRNGIMSRGEEEKQMTSLPPGSCMISCIAQTTHMETEYGHQEGRSWYVEIIMFICLIKLWRPKNCPHTAIHLVSLNVPYSKILLDYIVQHVTTINILEARRSRMDFQVQDFEGCHSWVCWRFRFMIHFWDLKFLRLWLHDN